MIIQTLKLGSREIFQIGDCMIPIDRIKKIDLNITLFCRDVLRITTDDEEFDWSDENANDIRNYLYGCKLP